MSDFNLCHEFRKITFEKQAKILPLLSNARAPSLPTLQVVERGVCRMVVAGEWGRMGRGRQWEL